MFIACLFIFEVCDVIYRIVLELGIAKKNKGRKGADGQGLQKIPAHIPDESHSVKEIRWGKGFAFDVGGVRGTHDSTHWSWSVLRQYTYHHLSDSISSGAHLVFFGNQNRKEKNNTRSAGVITREATLLGLTGDAPSKAVHHPHNGRDKL